MDISRVKDDGQSCVARLVRLLPIMAILAFGPSAEASDESLAPSKSWTISSDLTCDGTPQVIDFKSSWPGDSWKDTLEQYVAYKNLYCTGAHGAFVTTSYSLEPCEPDFSVYSNGMVSYAGASAHGCKVKAVMTPKPSCAGSCDPWTELENAPAPDKRCDPLGTYGRGLWFYVTGGDSYGECRCPPDKTFVASANKCVPKLDRFFSTRMHCKGIESGSIGNPIDVFRGKKTQELSVFPLSGRDIRLVYDSSQFAPLLSPDIYADLPPAVSIGNGWTTSGHSGLVGQGSDLAYVQVTSADLNWQTFVKDSYGEYRPLGNAQADLTKLGTNWLFKDYFSRAQTRFGIDGKPAQIGLAFGGNLTPQYSDAGTSADVSSAPGQLIAWNDQFGRSVQFHYEQPPEPLGARIKRFVAADGLIVKVGYNGAGQLASVTWPDESSIGFVYERADLPWALTGIVDENGDRYASFGYDSVGRATSTEHAGATNRYSAQWTNPPFRDVVETYDEVAGVVWRDHMWTVPEGTRVQDPLGNSLELSAALINSTPVQTARSQPGGSGCEAASSELVYDTRANIVSRLDFGAAGADRRRTCSAYAADRDVETHRVEGLLESAACPADLSSYQVPAVLPADKPQRKISTLWHPLWKLQARRAEPHKITTTVYNGQPDPIAGGTAGCAVGAPPLPDGSPIAVVCKRYEQATADSTGNQGFGAAPLGTRVWSYTYNTYGQLLTETDPRGGVTTRAYWADTSFVDGSSGHWLGDLKSETNPQGHKTEYQTYNKRGQVLRLLHPNGSTEQREYHVRGWLTKVTLTPAGASTSQVTLYDYYPTGLLKQATQPDGSWARYTYDAAHRLTDVTDSLGNAVHYTLDAAGNATRDEFKDPSGTLVRTISRTFDALGRMSGTTGVQ